LNRCCFFSAAISTSTSWSSEVWESVSCQLHSRDGGIDSLTLLATKWPHGPCPSKIPQKIMSSWHPNSYNQHQQKSCAVNTPLRKENIGNIRREIFDAATYFPHYAAILIHSFLSFFGEKWGKVVWTVNINGSGAVQHEVIFFGFLRHCFRSFSPVASIRTPTSLRCKGLRQPSERRWKMPHQHCTMIPPLHAAYLCLFYSLDVYGTELDSEKLHRLSMSHWHQIFRKEPFIYLYFILFLDDYQKSEIILCTVMGDWNERQFLSQKEQDSGFIQKRAKSLKSLMKKKNLFRVWIPTLHVEFSMWMMSGKIKDYQNWSPASLNHAMRPSLIEATRKEIWYAYTIFLTRPKKSKGWAIVSSSSNDTKSRRKFRAYKSLDNRILLCLLVIGTPKNIIFRFAFS